MVREAARNVNRAPVETIAPLRPLDPIALGSAAAILCLFPFAEPPGPTRSPSCDRLGSSSSHAFFGNEPREAPASLQELVSGRFRHIRVIVFPERSSSKRDVRLAYRQKHRPLAILRRFDVAPQPDFASLDGS